MKVIFGGWYQRTSLHLSELYDLFALGHTKLSLSSEKLIEFKNSFDFKSVERVPGYLELVEAKTNKGIILHYYEDGLYTLEIESDDVLSSKKLLEEYFNTKILPAVSYIFSLGAPTPKIVANIKTEHPTVVTNLVKDLDSFKIDPEKFGEVYSKVVSGNFAVYKTPEFIFVLSNHKNPETLSNLVDMQIFFREFKDQLEKYLNVHRDIWEDVSKLNERKQIRGKEIVKQRTKFEQYLATVDLISNRINQMGNYIKTRQTIAKELDVEEGLLKLFQYKFDSLNDTLSYIKEIWKMTSDFTSNSLKLLQDLENNSLNNSVKSLQIITSVGVISGVLSYITRTSLPTPTFYGIEFFIILVVFSFVINFIISLIYRNLSYKIKIVERKENI